MSQQNDPTTDGSGAPSEVDQQDGGPGSHTETGGTQNDPGSGGISENADESADTGADTDDSGNDGDLDPGTDPGISI